MAQNDSSQPTNKNQPPSNGSPDGKQSRPARSKRGRNRSRGRRSQRSKGQPRQIDRVSDAVRNSFLACGRCSYFYAGLRAQLGQSGLTTLTHEAENGWLKLWWSTDLQSLVEGCFGHSVHTDTLTYQGTCRECGRAYVVMADEDSAELSHFEIQSLRSAAQLR